MRLTWRSTLTLAVVVGLVAFFGAIVIQQAWAQAKGPADFEFAGGGQGKVVYSHEKHSAKIRSAPTATPSCSRWPRGSGAPPRWRT